MSTHGAELLTYALTRRPPYDDAVLCMTTVFHIGYAVYDLRLHISIA